MIGDFARTGFLFVLLVGVKQSGTTEELQVRPSDTQEQVWTKVQFLSGGVGVTAPKVTWSNILSISPRSIQLKLRDGQRIEIEPERVTALTYAGQRRPREGLAGGIMMVAPLPGLIALVTAKSKAHYIGIEYLLSDGRSTGILIRADKKNYNAILETLRAVTKISGPDSDALPGG